jgi:hypothetical protein
MDQPRHSPDPKAPANITHAYCLEYQYTYLSDNLFFRISVSSLEIGLLGRLNNFRTIILSSLLGL